MDNVASNGAPVNPYRARSAQDDVEPILSCSRARVFLASLKGFKKCDHTTLCRLVIHEGLPKHQNPFGGGGWVFLASEMRNWFNLRMAAGQSRPVPGPGRPRKRIA